jgi:hypothetical protein
MKNSKKNVSLFLTGGLGNQLFQFAAALAYSHGRVIQIYEKLGAPRVNSKNEPEIYSFNIEEIATIRRRKEFSRILSKSSGYLLRSNIWPKNVESLRVWKFLAKAAAMFCHIVIQRQALYPVVIPDVGYRELKCNKILDRFSSPYLIGYFQSAVWPEAVVNQLRKLKLDNEGPMLMSLRMESSHSRPVIVHIRRGDYKVETSFGLPAEKYYREALDVVDEKYSTNPIWVFSDEEIEARKILNWLPESRLRFISDVDGDSGASLMAMRFGCAYVIANSTFSWWAAFLSESENPLIIAPTPWFVGQKEPTRLIPSNWLRIEHQNFINQIQ